MHNAMLCRSTPHPLMALLSASKKSLLHTNYKDLLRAINNHILLLPPSHSLYDSLCTQRDALSLWLNTLGIGNELPALPPLRTDTAPTFDNSNGQTKRAFATIARKIDEERVIKRQTTGKEAVPIDTLPDEALWMLMSSLLCSDMERFQHTTTTGTAWYMTLPLVCKRWNAIFVIFYSHLC